MTQDPTRDGPARRVRPTRVVIAHESPFVQLGLNAALQDAGMEAAAVTGDAATAEQAALDLRPDAMLLPGGAGRAIVRVRADLPRTAFLFVVDDVAVDAPTMLELVAMADELVRRRRASRANDGTPAALLSPQEAEILAAPADGAPAREVATQLGISPATVRRHVANAIQKLGVTDRAAALARLRGEPVHELGAAGD